jgi:hypothetical protein
MIGIGAMAPPLKHAAVSIVSEQFKRRYGGWEPDAKKRFEATRKALRRLLQKLPSRYRKFEHDGEEFLFETA